MADPAPRLVEPAVTPDDHGASIYRPAPGRLAATPAAFAAAVVAGDRDAALALAPSNPERDPELVARAACTGRGDALRLIAELGFPLAGNPHRPLIRTRSATCCARTGAA